MKKLSPILTILTVLLTACATTIPSMQARTPQTPEDQEYLARAMACPLMIDIEKDKISEAWSRANIWISRYSTTEIRMANKYIIDSANPLLINEPEIHNKYFGPSSQAGIIYSYKVLGEDVQVGFKINVQCFSNLPNGDMSIKRNAHILAHYIKSAELKPHLIYTQ